MSACLAYAELLADAIAGPLAGALYGVRGIPQEWLANLAWKPRIEGMAAGLLDIEMG